MRKKLILIGSLIVVLAILGTIAFLVPKKQRGRAETTIIPHANFSHIKTFKFIYTLGLSSPNWQQEVQWAASHYDWVGFEFNDIVQYFRQYSSAPVWPYSLYHSLQDKSADYEWLRNWAKTNDKSWEDMFDHFSQNTVHRPSNESAATDTSQEQEFDSVLVYDGANYTDRTAYSWNLVSFPIGNDIGWITYSGYDDPFREINFTLQQKASADWSGVWEYWNGTTWTALNPTDGTADMTQNGRVEKIPPPLGSWKQTTLPAPNQYCPRSPSYCANRWWLRLRTTAKGTTQPIVAAGGLTGRKYVTFSNGLYTVPGWDPANDTNGDGYAELNNNPSATARFRYESRATYYELFRYYLNIGSADTRAALVAMMKNYIDQPLPGGVHYNSLFLDNAQSTIILDNFQSGGATIEDTSPAAWVNNTILTLRAIKSAVGPGVVVFINTSEYIDPITDSFINEVDGYHAENYIKADLAYPRERLDATINRDNRGKWGQIWASARPINNDWDRGRIASLALYYLMSGANTYYDWGMDRSDDRFNQQWYKAVEFNVGQPKGSYQIFAMGADPSLGKYDSGTGVVTTSGSVSTLTDTSKNWSPADYWKEMQLVDSANQVFGIWHSTSNTLQFWRENPPYPANGHYEIGNFIYTIYSRDFDNALVLSKPVPAWDDLERGDISGTTHNLPSYDKGGGQTSNRYQKLNSDGTIDPNIITSITLKNAEGAILVKTDVAQGISLTKSADKSSVQSGQTITYTINYNVTATANNAKIEDNIPNGTTFLQIISGPGTFDSANNKVIWSLGNKSTGDSGSVSFKVTVN